MTFGQRFLLTIAIVLSIMFALAYCGYDRWSPDVGAQPLPPPRPELRLQPGELSQYERQFIELDRAAISEAYRDQIHHLFLGWAKDDRDQPQRAVTGARRARVMYERSMQAIDERERRLNERRQ